MGYSIAANIIVILHLAFVVFVVMGGLLVIKRRWIAFMHLPAAVWGALIEFRGWLCPLTPLEQKLRLLAGQRGYEGDFIEHYILPILYPSGLTHETQIILGISVIIVNAAIYTMVLMRLFRKKTR